MKIPDIRLYLPRDYGEVVSLITENAPDGMEYVCAPEAREELEGGLGLVAHDEKSGDLVGFVWALSNDKSIVAYVDYYVVHRDHKKSSVGVALIMTLSTILGREGVRKLVGVVAPGNHAFLRMLSKRGAKIYSMFNFISIDVG